MLKPIKRSENDKAVNKKVVKKIRLLAKINNDHLYLTNVRQTADSKVKLNTNMNKMN